VRQDLAFHDLTDVSGTATSISANASKYRLGVGKKLGEGIQSLASVLGGFAYAASPMLFGLLGKRHW